jgi:hypothetical protein
MVAIRVPSEVYAGLVRPVPITIFAMNVRASDVEGTTGGSKL